MKPGPSKNSPKKKKTSKVQAKPPTTDKSGAKSRSRSESVTTAKSKKPTQSGSESHIGPDMITPQMRQMMQSKFLAANLGNIVVIMMRSPMHKAMPLSELYELVVPAIQNNQVSIAEAYNKESGLTVPAGFALWARVSEEVDQRLSQNPSNPIRLKPDEWSSGDIFWLVDLIGEKRFVAPMLRKLNQAIFKGKPVKYLATSKDGKVVVMCESVGAPTISKES